MSALAPTLQKYFTIHLGGTLGASSHTISAYRDTWRLLIAHTVHVTATSTDQLRIEHFGSDQIITFLDHLQHERGNSIRTRNARLAAIHSFFAYAALQHPEHGELISRVLAIPLKRHDRVDITYLTTDEVDAVLHAPDRKTWTGRRDHALLLSAVTTGMRVSELTGLRWADIHLGTGAHTVCRGKGRKDRATPLNRATVTVLGAWRKEQHPTDTDPVFPNRRGTRMSTDAIAQRLTLHATNAATACATLTGKHLTPHVLRHTTAMRMLHAGIDTSVIALWLGHESTETTAVYLHADLRMKEAALERVRPITTRSGRFTPKPALLAFLEGL